MTNLKLVSDSDLHQNTKQLVVRERELLTEILNHLAEVDSRRLYLKMGLGSLWDYCTLELQYSSGAASRRIAAVRLLRELPTLEKPIQDGTLNLSTLHTVQSFLKQEKINQKTYSKNEKLELLKKVENKSTRECLKILADIAPESVIKPEKIKPINSTDVIMTITVTEDFLREVEELKNLISHELKSGTVSEVFKLSVQKVLHAVKKKKGIADPKPMKHSTSTADYAVKESENNLRTTSKDRPHKDQETKASSNAQQKQTRYYSPEIMRATWKRANHHCEFIDPRTKKRCTSRWRLQIDHIQPHSMQGSNEPDNLRLLCQNHHSFFTEQIFGKWEAVRCSETRQ